MAAKKLTKAALKKRTKLKDGDYIFFTGAFLLKAAGPDSWIGSIKQIKNQHKLSAEDVAQLAENLRGMEHYDED